MKQSSINKNNCIQIKTFSYMSNEPRNTKSRSFQRNPIRIVVDKLGQDGQYHRHIVSQFQEQQKSLRQQFSSKLKDLTKTKKQDFNLHTYYTQANLKKPQHNVINSQLFNRFTYNNKQKVPAKTNRKIFRTSPNKINYNSQKNLQIVFCQNRFPDFVTKTNNKIQQIYKKQQKTLQLQNRKYMLSTMRRQMPQNIRKASKTTLANCLKQYGTLQKLSLFMQSDRKMRQSCLCFQMQKDPSKTVLLDVLTHRFTFMKQLNKRIRQNIYKIILGRDHINILTKINIQEYMRFYQIFVGRDSSNFQIATFMYLLLFGNSLPSLQLARSVIEQLNGPISKQRIVIEELRHALEQNNIELMSVLCINVRLLQNFIDLFVQK